MSERGSDVKLKPSVAKYFEEMKELSRGDPFIVFLCGPALDTNEPTAAAKLRKKLKSILEKDDFEVVLGEDDGLEDGRLRFSINAQDNELEFIKKSCNAIIIIADSAGSLCELGLFNWHFVHRNGLINRDILPSFIVIIEKKYSPEAIYPKKSYLNEGALKALGNRTTDPFYVNFDEFDVSSILNILRSERSRQILDRTGQRPEKK